MLKFILKLRLVDFSPFYMFGVVAAFMSLLVGAGANAADTVDRYSLKGHVAPGLSRLTPIGRLPESQQLRLAIGLPLRNENELKSLVGQLSDPTSTNYHRWLTTEQFTLRFGPTKQDYQNLINFANSNRLRVTTMHPNRVLLDVEGAVTNIEKAFQIRLSQYKHPTENRTFYSPDVEPSIPIGISVLDISGLNNYSLPHPRHIVKPILNKSGVKPKDGTGPSGTYIGNDFREAYLPGVTLAGVGQIVGLLQFGGYDQTDISAYESQAGLLPVPLTNVLLDDFDGYTTPSFDTNGLPDGAEVEVSLDIEMAICMAPGLSKVIVYEGGPNGFANDILNRMATDNLAKQLSCSWGWGGGPTAETDNIFLQFLAQGQSFFNASGDDDAFAPGEVDDPYETNTPSSSPYITQVGGTTLTTTEAGAWAGETVWQKGNGTGSGGGISSNYQIPTWQQGVSMVANQGSTTMRNIPDVALTADNVDVFVDGMNIIGAGTSCAAPLWAGLTALANEQAAIASQPPVGFINPAIYNIAVGPEYPSAFHDIIQGNNTNNSSPSAFFAAPRYDLCTGWGTPSTSLINLLTQLPLTLVQITNPPSGTKYTNDQIIVLSAQVSTNFPGTVSSVEFWDGANLMGLRTEAPYTTDWSISGTGDGVHNWVAVAWNQTAGIGFTSRVVSLTVTIPSPVVIVAQPQSLVATNGQQVVFEVNAGGTLPLSYQWLENGTNLKNSASVSGATNNILTINSVAATNGGFYSAILTNVYGSVTSSVATLTVNNGTIPPTVAIISPIGGTVFTNIQPVTITAVASDPAGVESIQFYDGNSLQAVLTNAPYTYLWNFVSANDGSHNWTVKAYDIYGNSAISSNVLLTVNLPTNPPTVSITSPASGEVYTNSQTVVVTATAASSNGVAQIQLYEDGVLQSSYSNSPAVFNWNIGYTNNGAHLWTADAYDADGNFASSSTVALVVNVALPIFNQAELAWQELWQGPAFDYANAITADAQGNVYVTGSADTLVGQVYQPHLITMKYDPFGNRLWEAIFNGGGGEDVGSAIAVDTNGNIHVTGYSQYPSGSGYNYNSITIMYNKSGNIVWSMPYNGPGTGFEAGNALAVDASGNTYVAGTSSGTGNQSQLMVLKYSTNGALLWQQRYNGSGNGANGAVAISLDTTGNVYISGNSSGNGSGSDYVTMKYSNSGTRLWQEIYNGPGNGNDEVSGLALDQNGNVYVTGSSLGSVSGTDYATIKYDANGNQLWVARYNDAFNGEDQATAMAVDAFGNVYETGTAANGPNGTVYLTIKYNTNGSTMWMASYNNTESSGDTTTGLSVDRAGCSYISGNVGIIKYDPNGNEVWTLGSATNTITTVDSNGNLYAVSSPYSPCCETDISVARYNQMLIVGLPAVASQPQNQSVTAGANVIFTVAASGQLPLSYQWQFNGSNISYGISSNLTLTNVQVSAAGSYSVIVSNFFGSVDSLQALLTVYPSQVQPAWTEYVYGDPNIRRGSTSLAVDNSGNVYVTGSSYNSKLGIACVTLKYDTNGNALWVDNYYGNDGVASGTDLAIDAVGNVYVTGNENDLPGSCMTIKYNTSGSQQWLASTHNSASNDNDTGTKIAVDSSGNVYVGGTAALINNPVYVTVKYNASGNQQYKNIYNGPLSGVSDNYVSDLAIDVGGNAYVTGHSASGYGDSYATIKYNPSGSQAWIERFDHLGNFTEYDAYAIAVDTNENVFVAGSPWMIKYASNGVPAWTNNAVYTPSVIKLDSADNVYITGSSGTAKYDKNGNQLWANTNGGLAMVLDVFGNAYTTGYNGTSKLDANGNLIWKVGFNLPAESGVSIALDGATNVYVTGPAGTADYVTTKYVQIFTSAPTAQALAATSITNGTAIINGQVNPNGALTTAWFEWGMDPNFYSYNSTASDPVGSGTGLQPFNASVSGLSGNVTYYYRLVAINDFGISRSQVLSFNSSPLDIGLRAFDGTRIIKVACEGPGATNSPVRFGKNGNVYGIMLTETNSGSASKFRIQTSAGVMSIMQLSN